MLAYLFWHWPREGADRDGFEVGLAEYHKLLTAATSEGFHGSAVYRVSGAPWVGPNSRGYEEWYLVEASFALDSLNEIAVSDGLRPAHDVIARQVAGMTAGLYRLRAGAPRLDGNVDCAWLSKPEGMAYPEFYRRLEGYTEVPGASLWRRQMVLGPTPEFCLLGHPATELPPALGPLRVQRRLVWPESR